MPTHEHRTGSSDVTRRSALARVAAVGTAGPALLAVGCESLTEGVDLGSDSSKRVVALGHEKWHAMVGDTFEVQGLAHPDPALPKVPRVRLELREATDRTVADDEHRPDHVRETTLSLLFVAPRGINMPNATYTIEHRKLGRFELFLHATRDEDHQGSLFEAVLN
jgi:hypothetical protein